MRLLRADDPRQRVDLRLCLFGLCAGGLSGRLCLSVCLCLCLCLAAVLVWRVCLQGVDQRWRLIPYGLVIARSGMKGLKYMSKVETTGKKDEGKTGWLKREKAVT